MRAKRSKKYRKTMSQYQSAFSFRPPYQVLLSSAFLKQCHAFHMPLQKFLDNTLHDPCRLFVTQCTLDKISKEHEKDKLRRGDKRLGGRPEYLPPPTEVPLRYCKHKGEDGEELGVVGEERCLLDLVSGQVKGGAEVRNKQHFVLAAADEADLNEKKGYQSKTPHIDLRQRVRMIPGVPIVYVKRSVMVLEELSAASEAKKRQTERETFKESLGVTNDRKRKRGEDDEDGDEFGGNDMLKELMREETVQTPTARGLARPKGPNPLSVKKKKKVQINPAAPADQPENQKKPSRRIRGKKKKDVDGAAMAGDGGGGASDGD
jgi:U3 small nucleolar RNA-associated protein 23